MECRVIVISNIQHIFFRKVWACCILDGQWYDDVTTCSTCDHVWSYPSCSLLSPKSMQSKPSFELLLSFLVSSLCKQQVRLGSISVIFPRICFCFIAGPQCAFTFVINGVLIEVVRVHLAIRCSACAHNYTVLAIIIMFSDFNASRNDEWYQVRSTA